MGTELEFNAGVAKFRIALEDFERATQKLVGAAIGNKQLADVRTQIKELIQEVRKNYDLIVDTVAPLVAMDTQEKFETTFGDQHAKFKAEFWKKYNDEGTSCHIVIDKMDTLRQRRSWMDKLPIVKRAFQHLENMCQAWIARDLVLDENMENFRNSLDKLFDDLAQAKRDDPVVAFDALHGVLASLDSDFKAMKDCLSQLSKASAKL